jgi:hypothetical protein
MPEKNDLQRSVLIQKLDDYFEVCRPEYCTISELDATLQTLYGALHDDKYDEVKWNELLPEEKTLKIDIAKFVNYRSP